MLLFDTGFSHMLLIMSQVNYSYGPCLNKLLHDDK